MVTLEFSLENGQHKRFPSFFQGGKFTIDLNGLTSLPVVVSFYICATMAKSLKSPFSSQIDYRFVSENCVVILRTSIIILYCQKSSFNNWGKRVDSSSWSAGPTDTLLQPHRIARDIWSQLKVQTIRQLAIAVISTPLCSTPKNQSRKIF